MNDISKIQEDRLEQSLLEAQNVLDIEANSVLCLKNSIDKNFCNAINTIIKSDGRVVFMGVGKSGLIAKKLAATFSSTGTPAFFVHAGEALHGDLGMVTKSDIIIAVSNSGETEELLKLIPSIKRIDAKVIALTGDRSSTLGKYADICIFAGVEEEACPHGLAPTASTTATMALGDALAIALSSVKGFTSEDFALYHPGGSLGRKLLTKVNDVMEIRHQNPVVTLEATVKETLFTMTESKMGSTSVVDNEGQLIGIITDGDIRRLLEKDNNIMNREVKEFMTEDPVTIKADLLAVEALKIMEDKEINDLVVVEDRKPVAMINFQDLLRARVL